MRQERRTRLPASVADPAEARPACSGRHAGPRHSGTPEAPALFPPACGSHGKMPGPPEACSPGLPAAPFPPAAKGRFPGRCVQGRALPAHPSSGRRRPKPPQSPASAPPPGPCHAAPGSPPRSRPARLLWEQDVETRQTLRPAPFRCIPRFGIAPRKDCAPPLLAASAVPRLPRPRGHSGSLRASASPPGPCRAARFRPPAYPSAVPSGGQAARGRPAGDVRPGPSLLRGGRKGKNAPRRRKSRSGIAATASRSGQAAPFRAPATAMRHALSVSAGSAARPRPHAGRKGAAQRPAHGLLVAAGPPAELRPPASLRHRGIPCPAPFPPARIRTAGPRLRQPPAEGFQPRPARGRGNCGLSQARAALLPARIGHRACANHPASGTRQRPTDQPSPPSHPSPY